MENILDELALSDEALVQFTNPKTGAKVYHKKDDGEGGKVDDLERPVGVWMVAPGSKEARAAETEVAQLARKKVEKLRGKDKEQGLTPEHVHWMLTEKAARMMTRYEGMQYNGEGPDAKPMTYEGALAFLNDPKYQHLADQIRAATADYGAFMQRESSNS